MLDKVYLLDCKEQKKISYIIGHLPCSKMSSFITPCLCFSVKLIKMNLKAAVQQEQGIQQIANRLKEIRDSQSEYVHDEKH